MLDDKEHNADHLEACRAARIADAYQIQMRCGYDSIEDAFPSLPTIEEYADRTIPGADPRIERDMKWISFDA